ncbi:MAG: hypothetical protein AAB933_01110 [Patescibacteria group bacterium]
MANDNAWLKPVMIFYGKTTSWIVFPLILAILLGKYAEESLFPIFIIAGFGASCFGIYREIKKYKKTLQNGNK